MSHTFAYCRVSTTEQTTDNQVVAITASGHSVEAHRVASEATSGSCHAMQRPVFKTLINEHMESGDKLVVLKLDRLGRDMIDVMSTLEYLTAPNIEVISLDLAQ